MPKKVALSTLLMPTQFSLKNIGRVSCRGRQANETESNIVFEQYSLSVYCKANISTPVQCSITKRLCHVLRVCRMNILLNICHANGLPYVASSYSLVEHTIMLLF